jgi:hypothetical protein
VHELDGERLESYLALSKEKADKINQLKLWMANDQDI